MSKPNQKPKEGLKEVVKAWPDLQQPNPTRCWFLELECGNVEVRPTTEEDFMPPQRAVCTGCTEKSCPLKEKEDESEAGPQDVPTE